MREPTYEVCGLNCAENRFCVAFNYKEQSEGNEWNCQLTNTTQDKFNNNASEKKRVWTFIKDNVFYFYTLFNLVFKNGRRHVVREC
jgi:hypothetical protein